MTDPRKNTTYDNLIPQVRNQLVQTLKLDEHKQNYYEFDLKQALKCDHSIRRFLVINSGNIDNTLKQIVSSFAWKKKYKLRELNDSSFPSQLHQMGGMFRYVKDKDGRPTLYLRATHHIGNKDIHSMVEKHLFYLALMVDDEAGNLGATYVFDLSNSSVIKHFDFSLVMSLATLRNTLPYGITHCIAIDLPFVARASWNIVKYTMPMEIRSVMITVSKNNIEKYIDNANLPLFLGGSCKRPYCGHKAIPLKSPSMDQYLKLELNLSQEKIDLILTSFAPIVEESNRLDNYFDADLNGNRTLISSLNQN